MSLFNYYNCQLECICFDFKVKTGPFAEHSNQLWNISGVPHWEKVNSGLVKMYKAEVSMLNRPPVKCVTILPQTYFRGGGGLYCFQPVRH